jgi:hypothetical protein
MNKTSKVSGWPDIIDLIDDWKGERGHKEHQRRILLTAFQKLKLANSEYNSIPVYSKAYTMDTFNLSNSTQNLTFSEMVAKGKLLSVTAFALAILLL